jgi:hypothetical protein
MRDPIHTNESKVIYTNAYMHAHIPNTSTRACLSRTPTFIPMHNAIVYTIHKRTPLLHTHASRLTHLSVWSVELWASAKAMRCAPSAPMWLPARLYAGVCVRRAIQRPCVAHDARSHTHNRVRCHIHPRAHAPQHTKYEHLGRDNAPSHIQTHKKLHTY